MRYNFIIIKLQAFSNFVNPRSKKNQEIKINTNTANYIRILRSLINFICSLWIDCCSMKNTSRIKAGKRSGNPGYRTSAVYRANFKLKSVGQANKKPT